MRKTLQYLDKGLYLVENSLIVLILGTMVLLAFLQVVLRNFFSTGILWGDIFLRHLVLWVGFIGASLATREKKHINIDVLTRILPKRFVPLVQIVVDSITVIVAYVLMKAAWRMVVFEKEGGSELFAGLPVWIFQLIIPIGFGLIGFRFLLHILQNGLNLIAPATDSTDKTESAP
ncbi:MAG: TRAP transporter small permease [Calditrichaeota bacterium]|nr:TRAP transporter small permease [Calditrichota bacterium]